VILDAVAVTKGTIQSTVVADGFLAASAICTAAYEAACAAAGVH